MTITRRAFWRAWLPVTVYTTSAKEGQESLDLEALPLFTSGRARMVDNRRAIYQLVSLERRTFASGRDKITHPDGAHDDLANVVAGAMVLVMTAGRPQVLRSRQLLDGGNGVPLPKRTTFVNAITWTDGDMAASVIASWAERGEPSLCIVDFALERLMPQTVERAWQCATHWAGELNSSPEHRGRVYASPGLPPQYPGIAEEIPRGWLNDVTALRVACGSQVGGGLVKLSELAAEKAGRTAFAGSLESSMRQPDVLGMAFMLAVVLTSGMTAPR